MTISDVKGGINRLINPYFIYALSFFAVLIAYLFKWSKLFPGLGVPLIAFLMCSMIIALFMGRTFLKRNIITFNKLKFNNKVEHITYLIMFGYFVEFLYHRNFPLLAIFTKVPLSYHEFGIPTFHVLLVTFNSFFSIYLFQMILSVSKSRRILIIFFVLTLIPSLLIMNRGMLVMILISCLFVYLIKYQQKITLKKISALVIIGLLGLYLFGVAGNVRVNNSYQTNTSLFDNNLFMQIGGATEGFKDSPIPKEYFWGYIYFASPLANLQETIDKYEHEKDINIIDTFKLIVTQSIPDFISKRVVSLYDMEIPSGNQIAPELNVSTAFTQPFVILGWVGISLFTLFVFVFAFFYILFLKGLKSEFFVIGVALMNTMFIFLTFTNMFSFTGLSFQLVYPLIFTLFSPKKI
jgi:oligosaccharide repeat unit polymerase